MKTNWINWLAVWGLLPVCHANAVVQKPNILWITGEDMSAKWLGCYGNKQIKTPNFDKFAQEGFLYTRCFAHAPVCAPSRSGWIMGIHPISTGTIYMRSLHETPAALVWYARYTAGVMNADKALGRILAKLKEDGLAEDTIVIYNSDHGGIIGRSKRFLYDSGTRAAFMMRIPEKFKHLWPAAKPGARIDRLISFIDMPKTWLAITGSAIPPEMQGNVFLGEKQALPRENVLMARERMDEVPDMQRALRDHRYLYIRNYEPFRPNGQYLEYLWKAPSMAAWEAHHKAGKTDAVTGAFFRPKPAEELFDCEGDPDNIKNLADDPAQAQRLALMREGLRKQQTLHHDCGFLPEGALVQRTKENKTTIYELIRNPKLYDQPGYMQAADLANFAQPADLPKLVVLLQSGDEGYRYWGVIGCIQLGKPAATPEVLSIMEQLIKTEVKDERTLDVRVTAALYLCQIEHKEDEALRSIAEVITTASDRSTAKGRAWANVVLLGSKAKDIEGMLKGVKLNKKDQETLAVFQSRHE